MMSDRRRLPEPILQLAGAAAICAIAVVVMGSDFLMAWAGDAVIHLRVAELLASGHGFEFNLGEPVGGVDPSKVDPNQACADRGAMPIPERF